MRNNEKTSTDKSSKESLILGHGTLFTLLIYVIKSCFVFRESRPLQSKRMWVILLTSKKTANLMRISQR